MSLILSDLRRRLSGRVGREASNKILNIKFDDMINDSIQEFLAAASWYFQSRADTVTLVNGTKEYSLASLGGGELFDKMVDNGVRLGTSFTRVFFVSERDFDQVITSPTSSGDAPLYYTMRGFQLIQLYPIPNATAVSAEGTISIEFFASEAILAADATASPLPTKYDSVVMHNAEAKAHAYLGNDAKAEQADRRWLTSLDLSIQDNRQVLETGIRDINRTSPEDNRQGSGVDQRRSR